MNSIKVTEILSMPDDALIDAAALAALLGCQRRTIEQLNYRDADRLPPRWNSPLRQRRWRLGEVREWMRKRGSAK